MRHAAGATIQNASSTRLFLFLLDLASCVSDFNVGAEETADPQQDRGNGSGRGPSGLREARLTRVVEGLKRRVEQLKAENEQLEELLRQADTNASGQPHLLCLPPAFASIGQGHERLLEWKP